MKLSKLILSGFKSFADRTEFDFDDGISCVVGPNGCGKSNIVDAVKWVLGEQSAKSLRGSEMMDVIFNGSSARKASGSAEVTLLFDNADGMLRPDGSDDDPAPGTVSVSRRLFRDGTSEYLINKAPARLKDIREMFMDTGIGRDAYSLIEQGRVEVFLQASQDERRAIFDEAAGISKYKARKKEALRKLDRVEQNLLRLNDIVAEVDKRLRSIKYQAGKARNYQAYSDRLRELKSLHFLAQYHQLRAQRSELQADLDAKTDALSSITSRLDQLDAARSSTDVELVELERTDRQLQEKISAIGAQITACEERAEMLAARVEELGEQIVATSAHCEALEAKADDARGALGERREQLERLEADAAELRQTCDAVREEHTAGEMAVTHLQAAVEDEKAGTMDLLRRTAQLHNEIHGLGIRKENLHTEKQRLSGRSEEIAESLRTICTERSQVDAKLADVREVLEESRAKLDEARESGRRAGETEQALHDELGEARERRSALHSRIDALREMQQRMEGVGEGVRRVVEARREGRLEPIRGMLGEFIESDTKHARIVEAALAGMDQCLLVERMSELGPLTARLNEIVGEHGSVELLCMDRLEPFGSDFDLSDCPQAVARVIDWVRFDDGVAPVVWRLLGRTLIVEDVAAARAAAGHAPAGTRFVTRAGEVLEPDGRVRLGAAGRAAGLIARRSELHELQGECERVEERIEQLKQRCRSAKDEREHLEQIQQQMRTAIYEANTERVECESRIARLDEEIARLEREQPVLAEDMKQLSADIEAAVQAEHDARAKADELEQRNSRRQEEIERLNARIAAAREHQEQLGGRLTEMKVSLASAEEKQRSVQESIAATERQIEQMERDLQAGRSQLGLDRRRREDAEASIQRTREEIDARYARQEELNAETAEVAETRRGLTEKVEDIRRQTAEQRKASEEVGGQVNALRVEVGEVDVRIESLIARASDEMSMELPELYPTYEHDEDRDWDAVGEEIKELRGKIDRLGNVNLDAIAEQDELEKRREFLAGQLQDVEASRNQLTELIRRINRESRELFLRTFNEVRENFQELFRKLFGGGRADILLVDPEDVLESGIEIVARPPGKETRSLSLLSGGEKTMTALALLFSIFRSRPSPFCLLDEVDAALDEANNRRFNTLVQEFVSDSQFIIITHSKPTMGMANVLYGVTMQEAGVSKRISVRFEEAREMADEPEPVGA